MINTFQALELNTDYKNDYDIQAGLAYDVTGLGNYVDPNKFVDGRAGYQNIPGENLFQELIEDHRFERVNFFLSRRKPAVPLGQG